MASLDFPENKSNEEPASKNFEYAVSPFPDIKKAEHHLIKLFYRGIQTMLGFQVMPVSPKVNGNVNPGFLTLLIHPFPICICCHNFSF